MNEHWTPERLMTLVEILNGLAEYDAERELYYFSGRSLAIRVVEAAGGAEVITEGQVKDGLNLLRAMGGLEKGRPGGPRSGLRRPYYPERLQGISAELIEASREALRREREDRPTWRGRYRGRR